MTVAAITFDLDNTLWAVEPVLRHAERAQQDWLLANRPRIADTFDPPALFEFNKSVWKRHPQLAHHVSQMRKQMLYELQLMAGYSEEAAHSGARKAFDVFLRARQQVEFYAEALEVLELLAQDYTLGALTNGNADIYKTDAAAYFDFAFLAEDIGASKPHPNMFQAAVERVGVPAEQIVHVGDDPEHDIRGARNVGLRTVWISSNGEAWPGGPRADAEITNLGQLPSVIDRIH
ncbi:MAG: HAD family hydrolase [Halioglobus sp.]|nr:HAD family hydrolase [Halioglobus sp.]